MNLANGNLTSLLLPSLLNPYSFRYKGILFSKSLRTFNNFIAASILFSGNKLFISSYNN